MLALPYLRVGVPVYKAISYPADRESAYVNGLLCQGRGLRGGVLPGPFRGTTSPINKYLRKSRLSYNDRRR